MTQTNKESVVIHLMLLIIGVGLYASTHTQGFAKAEPAQFPMFFPRLILGIWIGLSGIALWQSLKSSQSSQPVASWPRILIVLAATLVYTNLIGPEGFFIPSVIFALICLWSFGIRSVALTILFAIVVPGSLVLLFNHILGMPLPTSRFTYYF